MIQFLTAHQDGTWIESEGLAVSIPEMAEFQFVIHQYHDEFRVSEVSSGLRVSAAASASDAVRLANEKMADATTERIKLLKAQARAKAKEREEWIFQQAIKEAEGLCGKSS
jgi:hypothetical protein